jgi:hypothetical protein
MLRIQQHPTGMGEFAINSDLMAEELQAAVAAYRQRVSV